MRKILILWILPLIVSLGLFFAVRPILAQLSEQDVELTQYLKINDVEVGSEERNGFRQIFYIYNGEKVFITDTNYPNANPKTEREYIVWQVQIDNGWRIFLYHIPTAVTTQLTQTGIHVNPQIDSGRVIWEGQDDGVWQINLFDGISARQLTYGDMSLNPDIEGDFIVYGRKDSVGWRGVAYSLREKKEMDITTGEEAMAPKIKEGRIILADGTKDFPLTAQDLFVLDLAPLTGSNSIQSVSEEDIVEELEAIPTDEIEQSGSPETIEEATDSGVLQ